MLFVDEDRQAHLLTASEENQAMPVHLLSGDCLKTSGNRERIFHPTQHESACRFKPGRILHRGIRLHRLETNPRRSAAPGRGRVTWLPAQSTGVRFIIRWMDHWYLGDFHAAK